MLIEAAISDAYGAGYEFAPVAFIAANNDGKTYVARRGHSERLGRYTDDTQMSLAVAEAMLLGPLTPEILAAKFIEAYHRDPRTGYARHFKAFLEQNKTAEEFLANIRNSSERSGAAMRASPIGLFGTINEVIDNATLQAKLTHDTEAGVQAAVASALMTHYFAYGLGAKKNLGDFLASHVEGPWQIPYEGEVGNVGWQVVQAAVTAIRRTNSLRQLLKNCISFSGDTDTIAVVALSAASFSSEFAYDLPSQLFDGLENATYGRDYIMEVEFKLLRSQGFAPHYFRLTVS